MHTRFVCGTSNEEGDEKIMFKHILTDKLIKYTKTRGVINNVYSEGF
jgi:hypothetical protein